MLGDATAATLQDIVSSYFYWEQIICGPAGFGVCPNSDLPERTCSCFRLEFSTSVSPRFPILLPYLPSSMLHSHVSMSLCLYVHPLTLSLSRSYFSLSCPPPPPPTPSLSLSLSLSLSNCPSDLIPVPIKRRGIQSTIVFRLYLKL